MIFIQGISIWYRGKERLSEYAEERERIRFLPSEPEPNRFKGEKPEYSKMLDCEVLFHRVLIWQDEKTMSEVRNEFHRFGKEIFGEGTRSDPWYHKRTIENVRIFKEENGYRIMFCDDCFFDSFSHSKRHGHNEAYNKKGSPFSYTDRLNETAFFLKDGEYGRICFNNRFVHPRTRNQMYEYCIYNIINCDKSCFKEKIFFKKKADFEYRNMKSLY